MRGGIAAFLLGIVTLISLFGTDLSWKIGLPLGIVLIVAGGISCDFGSAKYICPGCRKATITDVAEYCRECTAAKKSEKKATAQEKLLKDVHKAVLAETGEEMVGEVSLAFWTTPREAVLHWVGKIGAGLVMGGPAALIERKWHTGWLAITNTNVVFLLWGVSAGDRTAVYEMSCKIQKEEIHFHGVTRIPKAQIEAEFNELGLFQKFDGGEIVISKPFSTKIRIPNLVKARKLFEELKTYPSHLP